MKTTRLKTNLHESFEVYVTGPNYARSGILIIHDFWGVKDYNLLWAERFGELGYRAAVLDLYDGQRPSSQQEAAATMRAVDQAVAGRKMTTALEHLKTPDRKVAVLGWSFGGMQSQRAALQAPETVAATVFFYSSVITDPAELAGLRGPVLGIYAESERNWPQKQQSFEAAMTAAGCLTESVSFSAGHGFANPESPRYDADATRTAWRKTLEFLTRHLG